MVDSVNCTSPINKYAKNIVKIGYDASIIAASVALLEPILFKIKIAALM